jgi:Superinfection immunity protein
MIVSLLTVAVLFLAGAGSAALYLLPVLIGAARRVPDLGAVAVINVLLGWTLAGWAVALAMALRSARPAPPAVQVMQNLPPAPPPGQLPPAGWPAPPGTPPARPGVPPPLSLPPRPGSGQDPAERR